MEGHTDRGRLLRPGEYSTKEGVIKTLEDSVRNLGFANSGATKSTEVDQEFEELKDLLVPVIEKMIRGELTDEELKRELAEAEKKQDPKLDKYLVNIKKNYANDPFKQKISAKYEAEYDRRHLEWINKTEEKNRTGMNIGVLNMPHNAREWRPEQKEELHKFCPVFKYIYDPKDYPKIDNLLAAGCAGYRDKKGPENLMSRCPCLDSSVFAEDPSEKRKTLITVAVGSNYWRLLQYLSDVAQENPHMEFLLYRSMHRYNSMNNKFVIQATKFNKNVFFELNTEYVSKNKEDDPDKTLKILETAEPYCQYMRPYKSINDCYRTTRAIQSNENLTVNYLESSLSLLVSSRSFAKFYEEVTKDPSILTDKNLPQILEEIANSGCIELLEKITPLIISVFAEQVRYHMQPAKELVFPRLLGKRLADSFLHAAIRRGDKEMLTAGLILLQSLYKERELVKERNNRYYKKRQDDGEELKDVDMEAWNIYKAKENLLEDLETQLNSDQLNVLEFAIVQQQPEMEEILYGFKMPKKDKYEYLHKYVAFMNGDPEEFLADVVPAIGVTYPVLPIASLLPYISRGAQTIFELYAKWGIYEERRHKDMTKALEAVLYPSAACLVGPQLGDYQPLNDMKKTVAALLMAGAEIPPKKNQIKTLPKEIMEMLDYVAEARQKNIYEPDPEPNVETADERVFEFFKH